MILRICDMYPNRMPLGGRIILKMYPIIPYLLFNNIVASSKIPLAIYVLTA